MSELTQELADTIQPLARAEWDKMKSEFDGPDALFTMSNDAMQFLAEYEQIKECCAEEGFIIPDLVSTIKVTLSNSC